jgi:hypothetical protein
MIQTNTEAQAQAAKEPLKAPPFWPTTHLDEFRVASAIRKLIDPTGVDIHLGNDVAEYGAQLQAMSGSAAELMARMRMALEEARNKAIVELMGEENFHRMSATLQNKFVDGRIAIYHAAYTYCEYLNKRLSYCMDYTRSLLSYIKEDMYRSRANQQPNDQ